MIEFSIPGKPQGKGRPKFYRRGKHVGTYTPEKTVIYENLIQEMAEEAIKGLEDGIELEEIYYEALQVDIKMYFEPPKAMSKKNRAYALNNEIYHIKKPDIDNVIKSILDALNKVTFHDDSQVVRLNAGKYYSVEPRVDVIISVYESWAN